VCQDDDSTPWFFVAYLCDGTVEPCEVARVIGIMLFDAPVPYAVLFVEVRE